MSEQPNIERRLRIEEVMSQTGLSRAGVYRKEKTDPSFPKHIKDGATSLWFLSQVRAWAQARPKPRKAKKWRPLPKEERPKVRTALYRHFDGDSKLLYVGISVSAAGRLKGHKRRAPWFGRIARIEIQWCESRREALKTERRAIRLERPEFNIQHNSKKA